ncbi:[Arg8]-vasotocin receptor [Collichthys lucidus]|uniref:[Arg8]-vasotocin receptor n=1 Tax=Collichthys lucidus TaxID=240159 RepID=A0A4U5VR67_COLLU|nr:[Arg8]-vasotocin receptor [Collichthys lucidus]
MDPSSNGSETIPNRDGDAHEHFAHIRAGILVLIFVLATSGNLFFLGTLWKKRKRNTRTQLFLLHLCLADLVVAFFQVLPQFLIEITQRFRGTDFLCRSVKYLQVVGMFASAYMIVAITIDRYHAEVEEHQYDCWATFIEPWGSRIYITWITLSVYALPAMILLYCQLRICTTIYFNMKRKALQAGRTGTKGVSNAKMKTVKMTFVIIMTYTVQCLPSSCCWPVSTAAPTPGYISTTAKKKHNARAA